MILSTYAFKYSELYYGPIQLKSGNDMTTFRRRLSYQFLGAVGKLRKASMRFELLVCPPVCMEKLGSHWTYFIKFYI
jgi:hypothetical protein